jgi:hypothetical protein
MKPMDAPGLPLRLARALGPGSLALLVCASACGSRSLTVTPGVELDAGSSGGTAYDATLGAQGDDGASTGSCAVVCRSHADCQNSCPAVAGGVNCCDVASGVCFGAQVGTCPLQPDAAPE